jgi:tRNA-2-methylthio-N6-dimethylallyladenosine synthase
MVAAPVSVVYGCSHACTFCIIPQKRGKERSRPIGAIVSEARALVSQGVKEVMLLGQIVDRYGYDVPDGPDLSDLLHAVHEVQGLERIRFLTSHPNYLSDRILTAVRDLPRVMPQIEVPVQAGDDEVLENMRRGYTANQYRELVARIRNTVPDAAVHCDIIVGFPGETEEQFQRTHDLLEELRLDKLHLARYSPRHGTVSERNMLDDVPEQEKRRRHELLEALNEKISEEKMSAYLGRTVPVLVEGQRKKRWFGREPRGKLVFFEDNRKLRGQLVDVTVTHTGAWSMSGRPGDKVSIITNTVASKEKPDIIPLNVL